MTLAQRSHGVGASIALAALAWLASDAHTATELADYFARDWYVTEIIVFQRGSVMQMNSEEALISANPQPLPYTIRSLFPAPGLVGAGYHLDPETLEMLDYSGMPAEFPRELPQEPSEELLGLDPLAMANPVDGSATSPPAIEPVVEPNLQLEFMELVGRFEDRLEAQSYRWLPDSEHLMSRDARLLQRNGSRQVLLHGRWLQPVPDRDHPEPLFIQSGLPLEQRFQLEGSVAVTLGRYLHFQAQLSYREPGMGQRPINLPVRASEPTATIGLPGPVAGAMVLNQRRRMRSVEIHYIDHPKLGIIVRIDPVALPADLLEDFEALQESLE